MSDNQFNNGQPPYGQPGPQGQSPYGQQNSQGQQMYGQQDQSPYGQPGQQGQRRQIRRQQDKPLDGLLFFTLREEGCAV